MTASDFVRNGIYSGKSLAVRIAYKMSFELLCKSFPSSTSLQPLSFILSVFIQNFPEQGADEVKSKQTKDCNEFFSIFIELIKYSRKENLKYKENFDLKKLLIESILRMKTHQSNEKPSSIFEDKILVGYISLVRELMLVFIEESKYEDVIAFEQD